MKRAFLAIGAVALLVVGGWGLLRWREASARTARAEALVDEAVRKIEGTGAAPGGGNALSEAEGLLEEALDLEPALSSAERASGRLLYRRGEFGKALAHYDRALRDPQAPAVWFREAGHAHFQLYRLRGGAGRPESREPLLAALARYDEALERDPGDREALKFAGSLLHGEGSLERRDDYWGRLLEVAPDWEGTSEVRALLEAERASGR